MKTVTNVAMVAALVAATGSAEADGVHPAPAGDPQTVAERYIYDSYSDRACPEVVVAARLRDGGVVASCANGEQFMVYALDGDGPVAVRCKEVRRKGYIACKPR